MAAIDNTPANLNYLSPLNFKFLVKKTPHVNFFVQDVNIPGFAMTSPEAPNPFVKVPYPGEHLDYEDLTVTFKIDEDMRNYLEIYSWLNALGKPRDFDEYKDLVEKPSWTGESVYSDLSVSILTNIKNPNYEFTFVDAYPVRLSGFSLQTTDSDVQYLSASATFKYSYFNVSRYS